MRLSHGSGILALVLGIVSTSFAAEKDSKDESKNTDVFAAQVAQGPKIDIPSLGSVAGDIGGTVWSGKDLAKGVYSIPIGLAFPNSRGRLVYPLSPTYSPSGGLSEWGQGVTVELAIKRYQMHGYRNFHSDDFLSPWGHLLKGEDGSFYPKGLKTPVRVQLVSATELIAYLPDGSTYHFGGEGRTVNTPSGVYAWYLREAKDPIGERSVYSYKNVDGNIYLDHIDYGGRKVDLQYRIELVYEDTQGPAFVDYRSSIRQVLKQRVSKVIHKVWDKSSGGFEGAPVGESGVERFRYELKYLQAPAGTSFWLTGVLKKYASGESEPEKTFLYHTHNELFESAEWKPVEKLNSLSTQMKGAAEGTRKLLNSQYYVPVDFENNGLMGFEYPRENFTSYIQNKTGFEERRLSEPKGNPGEGCRRYLGSSSNPRTLVRLRGPGSPLEVLVIEKREDSSFGAKFKFCDMEGNLSGSVDVEGVSAKARFQLGPTTRLADLNHTGKPDLVSTNGDTLYIFKNISTPDRTDFEKKLTIVPLNSVYRSESNPKRHESMLVQDVNGDGIPDIILQLGSGFAIYYGKGNYEFDPDYAYVRIRSGFTGKAIVFDDSPQISFQDLSGDGIPEVIHQKDRQIGIFAWNGTEYPQVMLENLKNSSEYGFLKSLMNITTGDFSGSGNLQVVVSSVSGYYSLELTSPSTGLLRSMDDGKGNILNFEYTRPKPAPGVPTRNPVISRLKIQSTGKGPKNTEYRFSQPVPSEITGGLLGYSKVKIREKNRLIEETFLQSDEVDTIPTRMTESDPRQPQFHRVMEREYEDRKFMGIPYKRLLVEVSGYESGEKGSSLLKRKEVHQYQDEFCPESEVEKSDGATLVRETQYLKVQAFSEHLTCFSGSLNLKGLHGNSEFNFVHGLVIDRNASGLPIHIYRTSEGGSRLSQSIQYDSDLRPVSIFDPAKGNTRYEYDSHHRIVRVHQPDDVIQQIESFDEIKDLPSRIATLRGGNQIWVQFFSYDGMERLAGLWNNLFDGESDAHPMKSIRYEFATSTQPAAILETNHIFGDLKEVNEKRITLQSGMGEVLGVGQETESGWALKQLSIGMPEDSSTRSYGPRVINNLPSMLSIEQMFSGAQETGSQIDSALGFPLHQTAAFQSQIFGSTSSETALNHSGIHIMHTENQKFTNIEELNSERKRVRFVDEVGAETRYQYDALMRLVEVKLPGVGALPGVIHSVRYDQEGRVREVIRSDVGTIRFSYDLVTGLLKSKTYHPRGTSLASPSEGRSDNGGSNARVEEFTYDSAGRPIKLVFSMGDGSKKSQVKSTKYEFFYDGLQANQGRIAGQMGFRTGVHGPDYQQNLKYRPDGKLIERETYILDWDKIREDFSYYSDGTQKTKRISRGNGKNLPEAKPVELNFGKDHLGRLHEIKVNQNEMVFAHYNWASKVGSLKFSDGSYEFHYDELTQKLLGYSSQGSGSVVNRWSFNNRGLIHSEVQQIGEKSSHKEYEYSANRTLVHEDTKEQLIHYFYSPDGQISGYQMGANKNEIVMYPEKLELKRRDKVLFHYSLDRLGRVVKSPAGELIYGSNGRVQSFVPETGDRHLIEYGYDQDGVRLMKKVNGHISEVYLDDVLFTDKQMVQPVAIGGLVIGVLKNEQFIRFGADARGSLFQDDTHGLSVVTAYGDRKKGRTATASAIDFAMVGYDSDLGAYRMKQRDYDPVLKRFLTPDPLFLENPVQCVASPIECNLYGYAGGNPVSFVDPSGNTKVSAGFSISGGLGALIGFGGVSSFSVQVAWGEGKSFSSGINMTNSAGIMHGGDLSVGFRVSVTGDNEVKTGSSIVNQSGGSLVMGVGVAVDKITSFREDGNRSEGIAFSVKTGTSEEVHSRAGVSQTISTKDLVNRVTDLFGLSRGSESYDQTSTSSSQ